MKLLFIVVVLVTQVIVDVDGRMLYFMIFWVLNWHCKATAQHLYQIKDIPIEHYVHEDIKQDEIDVELMPRSPRLLPFFKNKPSDTNTQESQYIQYDFDESRSKIKGQKTSRSKRDTRSERPQKLIDKYNKPLLELLEIGKENVTGNNTELNSEKIFKENNDKQLSHNFVINDFLRFRRSSTVPDESANNGRIQNSGKFVQRIPKGSLIQPQKFTEDPNKEKDITRETRGATKEQWVKQSFPVQRDENVYEDNLQLSSEAARAPRVHFVTNGMTERDPLDYKFNREPRSGPINKYSPSDLSGEMDYYRPRIARNYVPRGGRYTGNYYDRYFDRGDSYKDQEYQKSLNYKPEYNDNTRKRRIIYYATLPEVPKNSRNDDFRRPYLYRDRYDERHFTPETYDNYRKGYEFRRNDEDRRGDHSLYPFKVSTDVHVREVKKNPERRIYSDVDRASYPHN